MKGILLFGSVASLVALLAGCGTMTGRLSGASPEPYYKGVDGNLRLLGVRDDDGKPTAVICYVTIVCPLITVVSLPVDAAVDTVLLPIDYVNTL